METEAAYFHRLASEERELGLGATAFDQMVHLSVAEYFEGLARVVDAARSTTSMRRGMKAKPATYQRTVRSFA